MGSNSAGESTGPNYELIIAWIALVVSVFALIIALFQAVQQCFASATGYASCQELVIGKWSEFTHRRFRPLELRFEVEFQTPVIFVSAPSNTRGPLGLHAMRYNPQDLNPRFQLQDEPQDVICHEITYLVGTDASYEASCTLTKETYDQQVRNHEMKDTLQGIRTADNESATWLGLIMALQRMERDSQNWQARHHRQHHPYIPIPRWQDETSHKPIPDTLNINNVNHLHTLTVGIQKKKKSWDTMPSDMKRPYATTTICHMIEILAMLGIHWKVLNNEEIRYRAQGNGFLVTGSNVDELGIVFTFQEVGGARFEENRIIPNKNVKELCFGYFHTIFHSRDFTLFADELRDMKTLQLASLETISETLTVIGCNMKTVSYFSNPTKHTRYSHLFSVTFEMLGMVGTVLQISGTAFRMLPNPSVHQWNQRSFSMRRLLSSYNRTLDQAITDGVQEFQTELQQPPNIDLIGVIRMRAGAIVESFNDIENRQDRRTTTNDHALYNETVISMLHAVIGECDQTFNDGRMPLVKFVLRAHLEVVLEVLNYRSASGGRYGDGDGASRDENERMEHPTFDINRTVRLLQFRQLDSASYGEKHTSLMEIYFFLIRPDVINKICEESSRESERENPLYFPLRFDSTNSNGIQENVRRRQRRMINEVWCLLVFRMICWLLLHDFHHMDIQVDKHELFESRLPVYIA